MCEVRCLHITVSAASQRNHSQLHPMWRYSLVATRATYHCGYHTAAHAMKHCRDCQCRFVQIAQIYTCVGLMHVAEVQIPTQKENQIKFYILSFPSFSQDRVSVEAWLSCNALCRSVWPLTQRSAYLCLVLGLKGMVRTLYIYNLY